jgi:microcystin-dependent protein
MEGYLTTILAWASTFAPRGWLFCQGQLLPISQYTALFSLISTNFGGDGRTTFGLPDLRGCSPMGAGARPGLTHRFLGQMLGSEAVKIATAQMPSHTHGLTGDVEIDSVAIQATSQPGTFSTPGTSHDRLLAAIPTVGEEDVLAYTTGEADVTLKPQDVTATLSGGATASTGGDGYTGIIQPTLVVNYIICVEGMYPSRP